jgi:hypothetical protein
MRLIACSSVCVVLLFCACFEHAKPKEAQQPARDSQGKNIDSVSRAVKNMMESYFFTLDSSMKSDPFGFDSIKLPDIDYTVKDSAQFKKVR